MALKIWETYICKQNDKFKKMKKVSIQIILAVKTEKGQHTIIKNVNIQCQICYQQKARCLLMLFFYKYIFLEIIIILTDF